MWYLRMSGMSPESEDDEVKEEIIDKLEHDKLIKEKNLKKMKIMQTGQSEFQNLWQI